jgi:hypothetical protein
LREWEGLRLGNIMARGGWRGKPKDTTIAKCWVVETLEKLLCISN